MSAGWAAEVRWITTRRSPRLLRSYLAALTWLDLTPAEFWCLRQAVERRLSVLAP